MTNVEKLQELGILEDVRERLGAEDGADTSQDAKINKMTAHQIVKEWCAFGLADFTGLKWKAGAPEEEGMYLLVLRTIGMGAVVCFFEFWDRFDISSRSRRVLAHIGPIPPPPQNDAE